MDDQAEQAVIPPIVGPSEKDPVEDVLSKKELSQNEAFGLPLLWHRDFDLRWDKESLHNIQHIDADWESFKTYIDNFSKDNDPLGINKDLYLWNESVSEENRLTNEELIEAFQWAIRFHDVGNILRDIEIKNGEVIPIYNQVGGNFVYDDVGAEGRSVAIFKKVIEATDMDESLKGKFSTLVEHLIDQTRLDMDEEDKTKPFSVSMRFFDQIGNGLFNENPNMVYGYIREIVAIEPDRMINPYFFYNFVRMRAPELIGESNLERTLSILGKEIPEVVEGYSNKDIKACDFYEELKKSRKN